MSTDTKVIHNDTCKESLTYVKTFVKGRGHDEKYLLRRLSYKRRADQKRREEMEALGCTQRQLPTARKEAKKNNNNKKEQNKTSRAKMSSNKRKRKSTELPENNNNDNNNRE